MILTEKGTLSFGIEYDGKIHRKFELREELFRDTVSVMENPVLAEKATKSDIFLNTAKLAFRLKIGDIPAEALTPDMILDLCPEDANKIMEVSRRLDAGRESFRDGNADKPEGGTGAQKDGI